MNTRKIFATLACLPLLTVAACSGEDTTPAPSTSSTTATTTSSTSTSSSTTTPAPATSETVAPYTPAPVEQPAPVDPAQPTFNPDSADGYGPGQQLPPLCERFPGQFDCNGNPIPAPAPSGCVGFGCSPEQDAQLAEIEGNATQRFWDCMSAGGTAETCRQ